MKYRLSFLFWFLSTMLFASESEYCFYYGLEYDSESIIQPVQLILNGGYGFMQNDNRSNYPFDIHFMQSWNNVADNLKSPIKAIAEHGWDRFFEPEILPFSFDNSEAHYWPNCTMHLVGGGVSFRMMGEWFRYNNYKYSEICAFTTLSIYHLLNKAGLFYYYGNHGELDLSFFQPDGDCISFGTGLASKSLSEFNSNVRTLKANLVLSWGVFFDRNNSLLASFLYSKS